MKEYCLSIFYFLLSINLNTSTIVSAVLLVMFSSQCLGQTNDDLSVAIDTITIKATSIPILPIDQVYTVSTYNKSILTQSFQQLSLKEYIDNIPGLFIMNANNYNQDLRIAIRGFGARSAFGIRGIKLVIDGIPETTPDGQGQIDNINLNSIERIEVLKGPNALYFGNATGGVINIISDNHFEKDYISGAFTSGSYGFKQFQFRTGMKHNNTKVLLQATHTNLDGYREHSNTRTTNLDLKTYHTINNKSRISILANYTNSPTANDPGSQTLQEAEVNPNGARQQNLDYLSGETVEHLKLGMNYDLQINSRDDLNINAYYANRSFDGRLPFKNQGAINLDRQYLGQGVKYKLGKKSNKSIVLGYDWAVQVDQRQRFDNENGIRTLKSLDQNEIFKTLGIYSLYNLKFNKLILNGGLRYDLNQISIKDNYLSNLDQSDSQIFRSLNTSIGINYEIQKLIRYYANFSTSFETPTLSELSSFSIELGGFNLDLRPSQSHNTEIGIKGLIFDKFNFDVAIYRIQTDNELIPFELQDFPGRIVYRNAGSTIRRGIETSSSYIFSHNLSIHASHNFALIQYEEYISNGLDLAGKDLPGIPNQTAVISLRYSNVKRFSGTISHTIVGGMYANDTNTVFVSPYQVTNIKLSYKLKVKQLNLIPFFGVNNIFSSVYYDNIRINAFGSRYYERAAPINFYWGVRLN